ncbi:formylmethanofuran-tetrahydromethanopterin formyltransferase [Arboricoccus pini]|uniref:Formylmethanofuran--tetrahydromethanopterin formyltransferase n=1 Tax=Arboricoccus pini TaxID=1963835 RepID=A0A212S013_9PROT|nr:formylmethanofuran--tetrahydromethanopterin N-formyltransferase [Arboricoccus pini]SNB78419.1 formylmethanofuran-tetrahydromethanopterin formyltransferase [Arboricoccus pini]
MELNGVHIEDTFAEAFPMAGTRLIITAETAAWAMTAATTMTGFATSVIACGCEAGIEGPLEPTETPDGRPGVAVLLFSFSNDMIKQQLTNRVGQCVLTCPTTACFSGLDGETRVPLGDGMRYFGDGFQIAKQLATRRFWRVPVMDGEFVIEDQVGVAPGIGGGNFLIMATDRSAALAAAEAAIKAMRGVAGVIMPFPGGIVRSGSKVGSKYKALPASTNDAYCPTIRGQTKTALPPEVEAVLEIVIDGFSEAAIDEATIVGIKAACAGGRAAGVVGITAGNYGGKLGPYHFHLHKLLREAGQ